MKITIKTRFIEIEIEDSPTMGMDNYTKRMVPTIDNVITLIIDNAIKLHNEAAKSSKPSSSKP